VDDLLRLKEYVNRAALPLVAADVIFSVRDDAHVLRGQRPYLSREAEVVADNIPVGIAGQLLEQIGVKEQLPTIGECVDVLQQFKKRMLLHLLYLGGLGYPRGQPCAALNVRLDARGDALGRHQELLPGAALGHVKPQGYIGERSGVLVGGNVHP